MVHSGVHTVKGRSKCNINFGKWFAFLSFSEVYAIGHELFVRLGSSKLPFNCNRAGLDIWWTCSSESTKASDTAMAVFFYNSIRCKLSVWLCIKYPSVSSVSLDGATKRSEQKNWGTAKVWGHFFFLFLNTELIMPPEMIKDWRHSPVAFEVNDLSSLLPL
jgi:hypothetical protein